MVKSASYLNFLRIFSFVEGVSTLLLFFVAMPLKYMFEIPLAVTIVGSVHGLLFLTLIVLFFVGLDRVPLPLWLMVVGIVGAIVPFGPFIVDRWLKRLDRDEALEEAR